MTNKTLTFTTLDLAGLFAKAWTYHTLRGHSLSHTQEDGSVRCTVYDVTQEDSTWIDYYMAQSNKLQVT